MKRLTPIGSEFRHKLSPVEIEGRNHTPSWPMDFLPHATYMATNAIREMLRKEHEQTKAATP